ncbi:hypothetical protein ACH3XX_25550, partial [Streptomyces scabiei]
RAPARTGPRHSAGRPGEPARPPAPGRPAVAVQNPRPPTPLTCHPTPDAAGAPLPRTPCAPNDRPHGSR